MLVQQISNHVEFSRRAASRNWILQMPGSVFLLWIEIDVDWAWFVQEVQRKLSNQDSWLHWPAKKHSVSLEIYLLLLHISILFICRHGPALTAVFIFCSISAQAISNYYFFLCISTDKTFQSGRDTPTTTWMCTFMYIFLVPFATRRRSMLLGTRTSQPMGKEFTEGARAQQALALWLKGLRVLGKTHPRRWPSKWTWANPAWHTPERAWKGSGFPPTWISSRIA